MLARRRARRPGCVPILPGRWHRAPVLRRRLRHPRYPLVHRSGPPDLNADAPVAWPARPWWALDQSRAADLPARALPITRWYARQEIFDLAARVASDGRVGKRIPVLRFPVDRTRPDRKCPDLRGDAGLTGAEVARRATVLIDADAERSRHRAVHRSKAGRRRAHDLRGGEQTLLRLSPGKL